MHDLIVVVLVSLVTSKGAHGIPGSAIVILAATLSAIPAIPVLGLVLILPVDWFVGIARAVTNLIGNCVATVIVAVWEKDIDRARAHRVLNQDADFLFVPAAVETNANVHETRARALKHTPHHPSRNRSSWQIRSSTPTLPPSRVAT